MLANNANHTRLQQTRCKYNVYINTTSKFIFSQAIEFVKKNFLE